MKNPSADDLRAAMVCLDKNLSRSLEESRAIVKVTCREAFFQSRHEVRGQ
ncbi:MAG: hypothetical protein RLY71_2304 [Pseudomonadota bacterium]|jgi:hypothetical protein